MPEVTAIDTELADAVQGFRRVLRRAVRATFPGRPLPPSEAELLVFVGLEPDVSVNDAARALQLAANTVSTLVGRLVNLGLLGRRADPDDRRAARLRLTAAGEARVEGWRRHRGEVLATALDRLDDADRDILAAAVPALQRLTTALEAATASPVESGRGSEREPGGEPARRSGHASHKWGEATP